MKACFTIFFLAIVHSALSQGIVLDNGRSDAFPLSTTRGTATILIDEKDDSLVRIAAGILQKDAQAVSGRKLPISFSLPLTANLVIIGSVEKSMFIQQLIREKKLAVPSLKNKWEGYQIQIVKLPFPTVQRALVIAGSDRRGTAYGVAEMAKQLGVSPWHWWADVPVKKKLEIYIKANAFLTDAPAVKYRGIFINDEAPALSGWSKEKFGGFNHRFYEKVFELMLRLKANYLWPAMWGNAFYDDDSLSKQTADNWGIVIGTSHHEPLMRAHDEWRRYGKGKWDYDSNALRLQGFWKDGMRRATNEKIVSIGMRGDGDAPMSRETATALLERIVTDQRKIIEDVTGKPVAQTPQLWALYKEVQDYYDKGMRVPDDVTLLLCDDNWGNLRKLPKPSDPKRTGGYGIYYHFDYVGGPRNYKWLNTNNLARVWEQMHLAYEHGVKDIWIVNVGDIKPMELPISFFLDYAWKPSKWNEDNLRGYYTQWAGEQFGLKYANEIGDVLRRYSQMSARRKPELLDEKTYNLEAEEWERTINEWTELSTKTERLNGLMNDPYKDAFFQLVLHPVRAFANLHHLYYNVGLNRLNAKDSVLSANGYADAVKGLYANDSLITMQYHSAAAGKWNHMMAQTHIGYTYWQQPPVNKMPAIEYLKDGQLQDTAFNPARKIPSALTMLPKGTGKPVFYEKAGSVSMEAEHWTKAISNNNIKWKTIPDIGKTGSGITTFPVTASTQLSATSPHVEYEFYTYSIDSAAVNLYFSPTLNFYGAQEGLQFAVSIDDEAPQIVSLNKEDKTSSGGVWNKWVSDNVIIKKTKHLIAKPGKHTLKYWTISPAVILQKLVIDFGGMEPSYLGPPETLSKK